MPFLPEEQSRNRALKWHQHPHHLQQPSTEPFLDFRVCQSSTGGGDGSHSHVGGNAGNGLSEQQQQPQGVYAIYKNATEVFRDGLRKLLPKHKSRLKSIDDFKRGADLILKQSAAWADAYENRDHNNRKQHLPKNLPCLVDALVFTSLDTSIRLREEQARRHYGGGDSGHRYVISVLAYCREVLHYSNQITKLLLRHCSNATTTAASSLSLSSSPRASSPRSCMSIDDVWDFEPKTNHPPKECKSEHENQETTTPLRVPRPLPLASPSSSASGRYDGNEDLIHANDRFQCIALLATMDRLMGVIRNRFDDVKRVCLERNIHLDDAEKEIQEEENDQQQPKILYLLMEASIAANLCIDCVKSTWAELTLEHAHIRSFYDLLAIVFVLPVLSSNNLSHTEITAYVATFCSSKQRRHQDAQHLVTHFIGDVIEACFAVDGLDFSKAINAFGRSKVLGLEDGGWEKQLLLEEARKLAWDVSDIVMERGSHKIRSTFLRDYKFIGARRRCILNTQKVLQQVFEFMPPRKTGTSIDGVCWSEAIVKAAQNSFDFEWHEDKNPARELRSLDRLLAGEILPGLMATCFGQTQANIRSNPGAERLLPLLYSLDEYLTNDVGGPVPMHITFGFHAILISIMALEGNGHIKRLVSTAKTAFLGRFVKSNDLYKGDKRHASVLKLVASILKPTLVSELQLERSLWNPFLAGALCLYSIYTPMVLSLSYTFAKVLRPVLHLYNAMRCLKVVKTIEFVDFLDNILSENPGIWFAGKSIERGEWTKNFLLGTGLGVRDVSFILGCVKEDNGIRVSYKRYCHDRNNSFSFGYSMVEMVRARDFSKGSRILFFKIYSDREGNDEDMSSSLDSYNMDGDVTECEVFIAKACRALRDDIELFGGSFIDITSMGCPFKAFTEVLAKQLEWDDVENDNNWIDLFGRLDFGNDSEYKEVNQIARLMEEYFGKIKRKEYTFLSGI